ncbi:MAG: 5'-3' exonuclease, partial [Patescibacteria group bacterium]
MEKIKMKETLLLIDSHALIYRFFYALPPLTTPAGESVGSIYGLARLILNIFKEKKRDYVIATFDRPEKTFRAEVFKEYKIQRPKPAPELISQFNKARELFEQFGVKVIEKAGYEADDLIGSLAEKFKNEPDLITSILSGDLDNLQLVDNDKIVVEIIKKGTSDVEIYNEVAVKNRYGLTPKQLPDLKGLVGDTSDNIPGVKGVGYKTAIPLLQKYGSLENIFNNLWE